MIRNAEKYICAVGVVFLAVPMWARPASTRTDTAMWEVSSPTMAGNTQIKPGEYTIKAMESQGTMAVVQNGKTVAEVPVHWVELPKKARNTEVTTNADQLVQIQFEGRTEAIQVK